MKAFTLNFGTIKKILLSGWRHFYFFICKLKSSHVMSCHIMPYHTMLHHVSSHNVISCIISFYCNLEVYKPIRAPQKLRYILDIQIMPWKYSRPINKGVECKRILCLRSNHQLIHLHFHEIKSLKDKLITK